jgi:hypothetical protein
MAAPEGITLPVAAPTEYDADEEPTPHFRQLFVTRSRVLRSEVMKSFRARQIAAAPDDLPSNVPLTLTPELPASFAEVDDEEWPLFLTTSELLSVLDASLPGTSFFGEATGNVAASNPATSGNEEEGRLQSLNEQEVADALAMPQGTDEPAQDASQPLDLQAGLDLDADELPGRRGKFVSEVTFDVFANHFKGLSKGVAGANRLSPLQVWQEIRSFIKGSSLALRSGGFVSLSDYLKIGRKSSSLDDDQRTAVYKIFKNYEAQKKAWFAYDEADFVLNLYERMLQHGVDSFPPIDQTYIDEAQDHTQAEIEASLCALIWAISTCSLTYIAL